MQEVIVRVWAVREEGDPVGEEGRIICWRTSQTSLEQTLHVVFLLLKTKYHGSTDMILLV